MTTPSLTPDGGTPWPPRDWLESLCERQPDGRWLVQAPPQQWQKPKFHLLPDDRRKDKYVAQVSRLMQADVAIRLTNTSVNLPLLFSLLLLYLAFDTIMPSENFPAYVLLLVVLAVGLVLPLIAVIVRRQRRSRLAAWLRDVASTPGNGSTTAPMTVRTAQDWEAVVESSGLRRERVLTLWMISLTLPILAVGAATYLNSCSGVAMLDPLFPERAREQFRAVENCGPLVMFLLVTIVGVLAAVSYQRRDARRRRAGTARAAPVDRAA